MRTTRKALTYGKYCLLPLGKNAKHGYALIDPEDKWVDQHLWTLNTYPSTRIQNKTIYLHKLLTQTTTKEIDHINRDKLDNRKNNLRIVDRTVNNLNRDIRTNNTSGHTGVVWNKKEKTWYANIRYKNKRYHLYMSRDKDLCIKIRKQAEQNLNKAIEKYGTLTEQQVKEAIGKPDRQPY